MKVVSLVMKKLNYDLDSNGTPVLADDGIYSAKLTEEQHEFVIDVDKLHDKACSILLSKGRFVKQ